MIYRIKTTIFLTLAVLLAGCANNTDMPDVSDIQDSEQAEQTAYQKATAQRVTDQKLADRNPTDSEPVFHAGFVYRTFIYEIWDDDTEPYAMITGVTDAFRDTWGAEFRIPEEKDNLVINYAEDATDFGWSEWHAPCGEFEVGEGEPHLTASSTLASSDDRYAVSHLLRLTRNDFLGEGVAWAEGAEGTGIGEYIIYNTKESWINSIGQYQDR